MATALETGAPDWAPNRQTTMMDPLTQSELNVKFAAHVRFSGPPASAVHNPSYAQLSHLGAGFRESEPPRWATEMAAITAPILGTF